MSNLLSAGHLPSARFEHVTFPRRHPQIWRGVRRTEAVPRPAATAIAETEELAFARALLAAGGIASTAYRPEPLQRRVPACLRVLRASSITEARRRLREHPSLLEPVLSTLLLGVTSFFRDSAVHEALLQRYLPRLARERPFIRIWCIGCSDGAEVYSLGILLSELGLAGRSYVLGMDLRPDAIRRGQRGSMAAHTLAAVPPPWREKYFVVTGDEATVCTERLPSIGWWAQDVLRLKQAGLWDMIVCRNMAMYLEPAAAASVWSLIENSLRAGGLLLTGKAERAWGCRKLKALAPCLYELTKGKA